MTFDASLLKIDCEEVYNTQHFISIYFLSRELKLVCSVYLEFCATPFTELVKKKSSFKLKSECVTHEHTTNHN